MFAVGRLVCIWIAFGLRSVCDWFVVCEWLVCGRWLAGCLTGCSIRVSGLIVPLGSSGSRAVPLKGKAYHFHHKRSGSLSAKGCTTTDTTINQLSLKELIVNYVTYVLNCRLLRCETGSNRIEYEVHHHTNVEQGTI